jgi:hypothetical protein
VPELDEQATAVITLPSNQKVLLRQPAATSPTTIRVAVEEVTIDSQGRQVVNVRTNTYDITTTQYELERQELAFQTLVDTGVETTRQAAVTRRVPFTEIRCVSNLSVGGGSTAVGCRLGGTVKFVGWRVQEYSSFPKAYVNYGKGNEYLGQVAAAGGKTLTSTWTFRAAGAGESSPVFSGTPGGGSGISTIYYTGEQVVSGFRDQAGVETIVSTGGGYVPDSLTLYRVIANPDGTTTARTTRPVEGPEYTQTQNLITNRRSLFNPKASVLMTEEGVFRLPETLDSPVIDLFSYIQNDINT